MTEKVMYEIAISKNAKEILESSSLDIAEVLEDYASAIEHADERKEELLKSKLHRLENIHLEETEKLKKIENQIDHLREELMELKGEDLEE